MTQRRIAPLTYEELNEENEQDIQVPKRYKVIIYNDDYTSMDFVIEILSTIFKKSYDEAYKLMLQTHHQGQSVAGFYPKEIAETKIAQAEKLAEANEFPLQLSMEPE